MRWNDFAAARPDLADGGRALFYQFGTIGLGFLATVRKDGGPRVHPMCPVLYGDGLYAFIEPGPKLLDLIRDGRYALHCFPPVSNEDAFYVTGRAERVTDDALIRAIHTKFWKERNQDHPPEQASHSLALFEFLIERVLLTRTTGHGDWNPQHTIWSE